MSLNELFQKRMFLLMLFAMAFFGYFGGTEQLIINKTVGWTWDISNWLLIAKVYFLPVYLIGYAVLALFKYRTNKHLSKIHLALLIISLIADDVLPLPYDLIALLNLATFLVFLMNMIWSVKHRKSLYEKNKSSLKMIILFISLSFISCSKHASRINQMPFYEFKIQDIEAKTKEAITYPYETSEMITAELAIALK